MTEPKHLFIPGPTNIPDRVRRAMNLAMEDIRAPDFPELTKPLFHDLKTLFKSETGEIFLFPSSGTGAWEAALTNTLSPGDRVIVASFGQFSMLWAKMCRDLGFETEEWEIPWGEAFPLERLEERLAQPDAAGIKAVLVCQNETATGVASDVAGVRRILDAADHPALLMVDGISSIACIEFRMDEWGVDLAIAGSQKGLMLPTGLSVVCASRKALAASETAKCRRSYFDFAWHAGANKDGYFPYTPATQLLRGLRVSLDILAEEGIENVWTRHNRLAEGVRRAVRAWGLETCAARPEIASDTVTAVVVPEGIDSADVVRTAYHRYNTSFGVGLSKVAGRVFRIGHLGALDEVKILSGIAAAEIAMRDCGINLQAGSGVGAAIDYYRETAPAALAAAAE
ncbi:MAG: aminotransferase class V-fold PLP-dependent enzyme [Alphaproteobacteria bacterium]